MKKKISENKSAKIISKNVKNKEENQRQTEFQILFN